MGAMMIWQLNSLVLIICQNFLSITHTSNTSNFKSILYSRKTIFKDYHP